MPSNGSWQGTLDAELLAPALLHELKQPLTGVDAAAALLERALGPVLTQREEWQLLRQQVLRLAEVMGEYDGLFHAAEGHETTFEVGPVVAHLVENAINAMESGGKLDVQVGTVDGDALRLRISDTGRGIPATLRERIFDPFFTTKDREGQVGLGLALSHSIVEAHHGRIVVESEEGAGAAFTVLLPAAATAHLA